MPKPKEKEPVQIDAAIPKASERMAPHLIYATVEFEVQAEDEEQAKEKGRAVLDTIAANNKKSYLRVKDAKIADKLTGYFFK